MTGPARVFGGMRLLSGATGAGRAAAAMTGEK
jgi:hypothetical protein